MKFWLALTLAYVFISKTDAQTPVTMRESLAPGAIYSVQATVDLSGKLSLPAEPGKKAPDPLVIKGSSKIDYDERILPSLATRPGPRTIRNYRVAEFHRTVGTQAQESVMRPAVKRMVVLRVGSREFPFATDGHLTFNELELVRNDVYTPALVGLLPDHAVNVGDRWTAANSAVEELTDMEKITEGKLECEFQSTFNNKAQVAFRGTIRGVSEDGPTEHQITGTFGFDLVGNYVATLKLRGEHVLLDSKGKPSGSVVGTFHLDRRAISVCPELADAVTKDLILEPNAENTQLLYEGQLTNTKLLYPRRWRISSEHGQQITLEEPRGNGVLITIEPSNKVPTPAEFQRETKDYLTGQKGKVLRIDPTQSIRPAPREIERFGMDVELASQTARMEYYIVRQPAGGATVAARLIPSDATVLRAEVDQIVKSLQVGANAPSGVVPLSNK
ncbi:MAG: hypothetical protein ACJ8C4_14395 [Gemmataceae bacterium]